MLLTGAVEAAEMNSADNRAHHAQVAALMRQLATSQAQLDAVRKKEEVLQLQLATAAEATEDMQGE